MPHHNIIHLSRMLHMLHNSRTVAVAAGEPLTSMMVPRSPQFRILPCYTPDGDPC